MKRYIPVILSITLCLSTMELKAGDALIYNQSHQDNYTWEANDDNQKKIAMGMITWGFVMAATAALLAGFLPHSTSSTAKQGVAPTTAPF